MPADHFYSFVHWEAARADTTPSLRALELRRPRVAEDEEAAHKLRVRRCRICGKYRVLPRRQCEPSAFECGKLAVLFC